MWAIITSRKGSERLKDKNIRKFINKPLIEWSYISTKTKKFDKVILSTDCDECIRIAKNYRHIEVPFIRPDEFSILMSKCSCIIGNSSSGVREACVFGTPVLNIGDRQNFRIPKSLKNIVTLKNFTKNTFLENLNQMINKNFEKSFYFGDGKASRKILEILKNIDFTKTEKTISYCQSGV